MRYRASHQFHLGHTIAHDKFRFGADLHFFRGPGGSDFAEKKTFERHIDYGKVGDDGVHTFQAGQRIVAGLHNFRRAFFGVVFHADNQFFGAGGDVHRAANAAAAFGAGNLPVGEIAFFGNLKAAEHGDVQMPAAGHQVRIGLVKNGGAGNQRNGDFHGVNQIKIFFPGFRAAAHAEDSIFAVEINRASFGQIIGD